MNQRTVREIAFHETYEWLMNDREGPKPSPEEGMHPLALAEWNAGQADAINSFDEGDDWFDMVIDATVCVVKVAILYGLFALGNHIGTWWSVSATIFVSLVFVWKFMSRNHHE